MFEIKISAESVEGLKDKLASLSNSLANDSSANLAEVAKDIAADARKRVEEIVEENVAEKMTYWKLDEEYGNSRKGQVIPEGAELFSSKADWESDQVIEEEADEEVVEEEVVQRSKEEVRQKMGDLLKASGSNKSAVMALLKEFKAVKFSDIEEVVYNEFYDGLVSIEKAGS